jgi:hypothetical protein
MNDRIFLHFGRFSRRLGRAVALAVAMMLPMLAADRAAQAQARLDARYTATLSGIPLGKGAWVVEIDNDRYAATATGMTSGLLRIFSSGHGTTASRGAIANSRFAPQSYTATLTVEKKTDEVRMALKAGNVVNVAVNPQPDAKPGLVPVTDAHRKGVSDPMASSMLRVPGSGDLLVPQTCAHAVSIFDGRMRYDFSFAYKRLETVKTKGYAGPVLVCAVYFSPVAGYVPDRKTIKYLVAQRDMEVWLAPIAGTRVLVPYRMSVPTPLGLGVLEATQFASSVLPPRAAAASIKTQ